MTQNDFRSQMNDHLREMLNAVWKYFDGKTPYISLPSYISAHYSDKEQTIETFARFLWGACFADDSVLSKDKKKILMEAIAAGTDKLSPFYWGDVSDNRQIPVEMTPIAFFVYLKETLIYSE